MLHIIHKAASPWRSQVLLKRLLKTIVLLRGYERSKCINLNKQNLVK